MISFKSMHYKKKKKNDDKYSIIIKDLFLRYNTFIWCSNNLKNIQCENGSYDYGTT